MPKTQKINSTENNSTMDVVKRGGQVVNFDQDKVKNAVYRAFKSTGEGGDKESLKVAKSVVLDLRQQIKDRGKNYTPSVEEIQDLVEKELILHKYVTTAKAYILYRERRSEVRREKGEIPEKVRQLVSASKKYFHNSLGEFVYYRTYARWIESENRRETWIETVDRYIDFMKENVGNKFTADDYSELKEAILRQEIMPSMRLMQFAGHAARVTNVCAYNCSFIAPSKLEDFAEIMYISMCGVGVGFSVESANIQQLPIIKPQTGEKVATHIIADSKEGWCDALTLGLRTWFAGQDIIFDYSQLRPAGARLKTMGGKSSGPDPLRDILVFIREKTLKRQGKRLTNLDAHDIVCKIGEGVVSGGVRRTALISLSDLDDEPLRDAKKGQFYLTEPQRSLANNSAVYLEKPSASDFLDEWTSLVKSGTGERGIFNRGGLSKTLPTRRLEALGGDLSSLGTNPCGEIILQSKQFCNLSEIVARADDTEESLIRKARLATILGTYQATLTKFEYLSKDWQKHCEQERLLGVSITGQWDCPTVRQASVLQKIKAEAIKVNKEYSKKLNINESTCITCVKPSGTVSQTVDSASGMHTRHSEYYIRRIRISATDSLFQMLKDQGAPYHPEVGQAEGLATTYVIDFPVKAPSNSKFKDDLSAIEQLDYWKLIKENFTEHNPSVTISVGENEWLEVAHWLYKNWEIIGGLSFLPRSEHVYQLAPYEEISKEKYNDLIKFWQDVDFSKIITYEKEDQTEVKGELACASGTCDIDVSLDDLKKDEIESTQS